jgi:hypothetical protein
MPVPLLLATITHDLPEDGQLVVYDDAGSKLVVLNESGAAIYFLIDGKRTTAEIVSIVEEATQGLTAKSCAEEIQVFLEMLESHQVLRFSP